MKKIKFLAALLITSILIVLLSIVSITQAESKPPNASLTAEVQYILAEDLQWQANPNIVGVKSAIALGDPTNSELYVLMGKMDAGAKFPTHTHPDNRITTVISGVMYYGLGETLNSARSKPYPAGSVIYTPAGTPHFMWTEDELTLMQETGTGPTGLEFTKDP